MNRPWTDDQRRLLCRMAFFALCLMPTAVVIYHVFHPPTPAHWAQLIQAQLGLEVVIDRVERPEPHIVILRGVTWVDPDRQPLARLGTVKIERRTAPRIAIDEPVHFSAAGLGLLLQRATEYALRSGAPQGTWRLEIRQMTIDDGPPDAVRDHRTLSPVEVQIHRDEDHTVALARGRVLGQTAGGAPIELLYARRRDGVSWQESIDFSTGATALPTWLAAPLVRELSPLGDQCQFAGRLNMTRAPRGWNGQLVGEMTQIDLDRWAAAGGLSAGGTGRAIVRLCEFQVNQIVQLDATLTSQYGWLGASAWRGLAQLTERPIAHPDLQPLSYSTASAQIRYQRGWIELGDIELRDRQNAALLGERPGYCLVALEGFAKTLWSGESPHAPITDSTLEFLHRFQLPPPERHAELERPLR